MHFGFIIQCKNMENNAVLVMENNKDICDNDNIDNESNAFSNIMNNVSCDDTANSEFDIEKGDETSLNHSGDDINNKSENTKFNGGENGTMCEEQALDATGNEFKEENVENESSDDEEDNVADDENYESLQNEFDWSGDANDQPAVIVLDKPDVSVPIIKLNLLQWAVIHQKIHLLAHYVRLGMFGVMDVCVTDAQSPHFGQDIQQIATGLKDTDLAEEIIRFAFSVFIDLSVVIISC